MFAFLNINSRFETDIWFSLRYEMKTLPIACINRFHGGMSLILKRKKKRLWNDGHTMFITVFIGIKALEHTGKEIILM